MDDPCQPLASRYRAVFHARPSRTWPMREALPRQGFRSLHAASSRAWSVRTFRGSELCADGTQPGTHDRYAPADAYQHQVRTEVRTSDSHPLTRTKAACLLSKVMVTRRWFPLWFPGFCSGFHWQPGQAKTNPTPRGRLAGAHDPRQHLVLNSTHRVDRNTLAPAFTLTTL